MKTLILIITLCILFSNAVFALDNQHKLNGFYLHQYRKSIPNTLGEPMQKGETDYSFWEAYKVPGKAYMLFEILKEKEHWIYSIQITGDEADMIPFAGLKLGDDESKIIKILGKPDSVKKTDKPDVTAWYYDNKNFSVEVSNKKKLYSIRINTIADLFNKTDSKKINFWEEFKKSLLKGNIPEMADYFRPDAEIYKNGEIIDIDKSFADYFKSPPDKFKDAVLTGDSCMLKAIKEEEPVSEMRLVMDFGVGIVFKFKKSKILEEIAFFPYAGQYRIYEVSFRQNKKTDMP